MSDGESSSFEFFPGAQSRAGCTASSNRADAPADAHRATHFLGGWWGREGQAPFTAKDTLQNLVSNIWEMLAQVSGSWAVCEHQWVLQGQSQLWEQSAGCPCSGSLWQFFWDSGKGHVGCSQSVCGASLDLDFTAAKMRPWHFCVLSLFLSWSSSSARLNIWVPFHDSPSSFSYALGREEEPVIMNKLAILCSSNCLMVCLSWWLQEWKISLWDDVEDLCMLCPLARACCMCSGILGFSQAVWRKWGFSEG